MATTKSATTSLITLLCLLILLGGLTYLLTPVLTPFLIAAFLAYLTDPLVEKVSGGKYKIPRTLTVACVFVLLIVVFLVVMLYLIPALQRQLLVLIANMPTMLDALQQNISPQLEMLGVKPEELSFNGLKEAIVSHASQATEMAKWLWKTLFHSGLAVMNGLMNVLIVLVASFYLLRDWRQILNACQKIIPKTVKPTVIRLAKECDVVLATFVRGQLTVMMSLGTLYGVGLALIGVNFSLLLGMLAGILSIVPYLGSLVGLGAALIVTYLQFHSWLPIIGVLVVFSIGHLLEAMVLTPILIGDKLGLHPVVVIFAVLAGGHLLGLVGVILALPITAMLVVLLRELMSAGGHLSD